MITNSFIYALVDPRDQTIFYVGQSSRGPFEPEWYIKNAHRGSTQRKVKAKLRKLHHLGLKAEWIILEETENLNDAECFWISNFRAAGAMLSNMTPGGHSAGAERHPDTGKNISKALRGKPCYAARKPQNFREVECSCCAIRWHTWVRPRDITNTQKKYFCSTCWQAKKERVEVKCANCRASFTLRKNDRRLKSGQRLFCTAPCMWDASRGVAKL